MAMSASDGMWDEHRIQKRLEERERAKATAGPEEPQTDGGDLDTEWDPEPVQLRDGETRDNDNTHIMRNNEQLKQAEVEGFPALDVGDHVSDRDDEDSDQLLLVVGTPIEAANNYDVGEQTIADYNADYPEDDDVIEVKYLNRTDVSLDPVKTYAFPRSRLKLENPIHDRGEDDE